MLLTSIMIRFQFYKVRLKVIYQDLDKDWLLTFQFYKVRLKDKYH